MKFCSKCGKEIHDEAVICVHCGCSVENSTVKTEKLERDKKGEMLGVVAFMIPIVGLFLWLGYLPNNPKRAKLIGAYTLVGVIFSIILSSLLSLILSLI